MELHGFLGVDKPLGWTSHDVVARMRRILGTRRVGHAGTLDPAATGVLIVGAGRATRFLDHVQSGAKEYVAHVVLGKTSDSADIDGELETQFDTATSPTLEDIERALAKYVGWVDQIPPKFSAIKQGGVPLYKRARRGEDVDVPTRRIEIAELETLGYDYPDLMLRVVCSAGTYVRSLARDLGEELQSGAYLHHLIRTRIGPIRLCDCWTVDQIGSLQFPEAWTVVAYATDSSLHDSPALWLSERSLSAWYHGRSVRVEHRHVIQFDRVRCYDHLGGFAGLGLRSTRTDEPLEIRPRIVLTT